MIAADISFWTFMWYAFAGLVIGVLARLFMPGHQDMNILVTIVLGVVSAILGAILWNAIFKDQRASPDRRLVVAVILLVAVLAFAPRAAARPRTAGYTPPMPLYEYECGNSGTCSNGCARWTTTRRPARSAIRARDAPDSMFAASTSSGGFRNSAPSGGGCACGGSCMCGGH